MALTPFFLTAAARHTVRPTAAAAAAVRKPPARGRGEALLALPAEPRRVGVELAGANTKASESAMGAGLEHSAAVDWRAAVDCRRE